MYTSYARVPISALIEMSGKTLTRIAEDCGVSVSYISKLNSRYHGATPSVRMVVALAASLGVPVSVVVEAFAATSAATDGQREEAA